MKKVTISLLVLICLIFNVSSMTYAYTDKEYSLALQSISRAHTDACKRLLCYNYLNGIRQIDVNHYECNEEPYGWVRVNEKDLIMSCDQFPDGSYYDFFSGEEIRSFLSSVLPLEYCEFQDPKIGTYWIIFNLYDVWEIYADLFNEF